MLLSHFSLANNTYYKMSTSQLSWQLCFPRGGHKHLLLHNGASQPIKNRKKIQFFLWESE